MNLAQRYSPSWSCEAGVFRLVVQAFIAGPFMRHNPLVRTPEQEPEVVSAASKAVWAIFKATEGKIELDAIRRQLPTSIGQSSSIHAALHGLLKGNWIDKEDDSPTYWRVPR